MTLTEEVHLSVITQKVRPNKKLDTIWGVSCFFALCKSPGCHTLSKAATAYSFLSRASSAN